MHRIGNTNAIKPNWRALVPDDGPSLSLSIETAASGATYVFRAFGGTFNVAFESKQGTFDDVFAPTSVTPNVLVPAGQSVSVPPGVGNVGVDETVLDSEPGQSYTVRFQGTSGDTVVTGERVYTLPEVIREVSLVPDELPLGRTTLLFDVEANAACTIDYSLTSSISLTDYWIQGDHNELESSIDIGNSFEATSNLTVAAFCRLPVVRFGELNDSIRVRLWDDETQTVLHERLVGPGAYLSGNMRCETLETPIALVQGKRYTISQVCIDGMADLWVYNPDSPDASTINSLIGTAASAWFHDGIGWPDRPWANSWPSVGLLAIAPGEEGTLTLGNGNPLIAQHRFEDLTPSTEYTCLYDVITSSTPVTEEIVATTLAQYEQIGLSISLERAPYPNNETTVFLFISVDAACSCEVNIAGLGSVPPRFESFGGPTVRRQLDFNGLLPNNTYTANVVATAPDMETEERAESIVTAAPFPNLSKFEVQSVDATYAYVTVGLDGPGSVSFHLESVDDDDYVREDVIETIAQEEYNHLFDGLVGNKSYKCICDSVLDVYSNEEPNGTEFQFTTEPPITVNATLTPPALPQGRTELVSEVNASKACSVELILSGNGEVYTQNYTQTGPGVVPRTFDVLTPDTLYTLNATVSALQGDEATTVVSASTLAPLPSLELIASLTVPQENGDTSLLANYEVNQPCLLQLFLIQGNILDPELVQVEDLTVNDVNVSLSFLFQNLAPSTTYNLTVRAVEVFGDFDPILTVTDSETTLAPPPPLELTASLSTPSENVGTSLVANFVVNRSASVRLTLTADGEAYEQDVQEGTQSFIFQGLTPSTLYTLTAIATAIPDGSEASATDTRSTLAPQTSPILISVDLTSTVGTTRPPVSGSAQTDDGHIVPFEGDYGLWNAILTQGGQRVYEKNNLLNGSQEETSIGVVVNSNSVQHYTYGFYDGGTKTNVGEDVIGLAMAQNTGSLLEGYFTGLDDSKRYSVRMFGQHVNQTGVGSVNFAKFGVNGVKQDTGPDTATRTWYAVAPTGGRIDFSLEYVNESGTNEYASLGGFQLREEAN